MAEDEQDLRMSQITKVGFYNPQNPGAPLETLTAVLEGLRNQLHGSLLVLPEAFNIGTRYSCAKPIQKDPRILCELQALCTDYGICMVAGLIIEGPGDRGTYPYSSAYLIDAAGAGLLCHKMLCDSQGPYMTCLDGCDGHNATAYRNVAICSLICMDSYEASHNRDRHQRLEKKIEDVRNVQHRVLCVPAHIDGAIKPRFWGVRNSCRVVANSASRTEFPDSPGSFIEWVDQDGNASRLVELEDGDDPSCIKLHDLTTTLLPAHQDVLRN
jgi:hypothetical protein